MRCSSASLTAAEGVDGSPRGGHAQSTRLLAGHDATMARLECMLQHA